MPSTSTFRIPKAEITCLYGMVLRQVSKRMFAGEIPDSMYVYFHNRPVLRAVTSFSMKAQRWHTLDRQLASCAQVLTAGVVGCSWCVDYGYYLAQHEGLDLAKLREVGRWRESAVFTPLERAVLEYADAMTQTPLTVTDEMVAGLVESLGAPAVVELTQVVALENMYARFNAAAGVSSQGFSDTCESPQPVASSS